MSNSKAPIDLDYDAWERIFLTCNLFYAIRMDDTNPKHSTRSVFKFKKLNNWKLLFRTNDDAHIRSYITDRKLNSSFVSSKFLNGSLDIPFFSDIGITGKYSKKEARTNEERTVYSTCCWNFPRATVELDSSYLELTEDFIHAIDNVLKQPSQKQIGAFKEVLETYGHVYPKYAVLGGHIYHTQQHQVTAITEEEKARLVAESKFKFSLKLHVSTSGGYRSKNDTKTVSCETDSQVHLAAVGGRQSLIQDPMLWAATLSDPENWRSIEYDDFQPVIALLDPQRKEAIQKMIKFAEEKVIPNHLQNATWSQNGWSQTFSPGLWGFFEQLKWPSGLYVEEDRTLVFCDSKKHRVVELKSGASYVQVVAGVNSAGDGLNQLDYPIDVIVDTETDSLIICDRFNRRLMRWPRRGGVSGYALVQNIACEGVALDHKRFIYVSDSDKHEVRRYHLEMTNGTLIATNETVVAGGYGKGDLLKQLNWPTYLSVDREQSVYVSDLRNHRITKWVKNGSEGIVVAGGQGEGSALTQLSTPRGIFVDRWGTLYVADAMNHRIVRWRNAAAEGDVIAGGNGPGKQSNQLFYPTNVSLDQKDNLVVVDCWNNRVQCFLI